MKKIIVGISLFVGLGVANAQVQNSMNVSSNRWTFGGGAGVGVSGGNGYSGTTISVSPRVGYKVDENFEVGVSGSLSWLSSKYFSSTMLGVGPFANYYFGRNFYVSAQHQHYFINQKDKISKAKYNVEEDALYLGGGYMTRIASGAYMQIGASYNVLYKENKSVFGTGFVPNIGIVWGL